MVAPLEEAACGVMSQAETSDPVTTATRATRAPESWRFTAGMLSAGHGGVGSPPAPPPPPMLPGRVVPRFGLRRQPAGRSSPSNPTSPGAYPAPAVGTDTGINSRCWSAW